MLDAEAQRGRPVEIAFVVLRLPEAEIATLRQSLKEVQGRYEGSQRARLAQERYCERIEVRLAEALARITKLQRLSEKPPQRSAA